MYLFRNAISRDEASRLLASVELKPKIQELPVNESLGLVLAEDVFASFPIPAFRRSGYDGYGILAEDDHDFPRQFEISEHIAAGDVATAPLQSGQTVRIMTGAKVPNEVAKVIMLEVTEKTDSDHVLIKETMARSNISEIGEEIEKGKKLLSIGTKLNAGAISLLNAFGYAKIKSYRQPRVGVIATGSELLQPGEAYQEGRIYNSNGPLLAGLVKENGGQLVEVATVSDELENTKETLERLIKTCDLVITTGGVSVGDYDFMAVMAKESDQFLFNKLKMRPGSPTTAFVQNETLVVALSGNPSACFAGFYFFAEPAIKKFQGLPAGLKAGKGILTAGYHKINEFDRYLQAYIDEETGNVTLSGHGQSSELGSLWQANCFFKVPHGTKVEKNGQVEIWMIP